MKLKALFMEGPVDFEKRCRLRILAGKTAAVLGLLSVAAAWFYGSSGTVAGGSFIQEFYTWTGIGFMAGGAVSVWKNRRYLKDEAALKKQGRLGGKDSGQYIHDRPVKKTAGQESQIQKEEHGIPGIRPAPESQEPVSLITFLHPSLL